MNLKICEECRVCFFFDLHKYFQPLDLAFVLFFACRSEHCSGFHYLRQTVCQGYQLASRFTVSVTWCSLAVSSSPYRLRCNHENVLCLIEVNLAMSSHYWCCMSAANILKIEHKFFRVMNLFELTQWLRVNLSVTWKATLKLCMMFSIAACAFPVSGVGCINNYVHCTVYH